MTQHLEQAGCDNCQIIKQPINASYSPQTIAILLFWSCVVILLELLSHSQSKLSVMSVMSTVLFQCLGEKCLLLEDV